MITFTYKGIHSSDMGVIVEKQPPLATPYMRYSFYNIRGYDGAITHQAGRNAHQETFTIIVQGVENFDKVRGWLYGEGKFTRSDLPGRYRVVSFIQQTAYHFISHDDGGLWRAEITLDVLDPYWISEYTTTHSFNNSSLEIENRGNVFSSPTFKITKTGLGENGRVTVQSDFLSFSYTFPAGESTVIVDTSRGTARTEDGKIRDRHLDYVNKLQKINPGFSTLRVTGTAVRIHISELDRWY